MTSEVFWQTIADYNRVTWPVQALLIAAGALLTRRLYRRPTPGTKVAMKLYLALLNAWIAVAYYLVACDARAYNGVMALFWGVMAAVWIYDAFVLLAMPFVYPLLSLLRGLEFPMMTSPVMPCSVAVFTIGLLLAFPKRVNLFVILFLCHWALVGFPKIYFFGIPEDLLLSGALVPALYLFFKEYIDVNFRSDTKPDLRVMNLLLLAVCTALGVFFTATIWQQLSALF